MVRRRVLYAAGIATLLVSLAGLDAIRLVGAYRNLTAARETFLSVEGTLLNGDKIATISAADVMQARARMLDARGRLRSASAILHGDPLLAVGEHLPVAGRQVRAAKNLAAIGAQLGDAGVEAADVLATLQQMRDAKGTPLLLQVQPALVATQPAADRIQQQLVQVRRLRDAIPPGSLLGPLRSALATLDKQLPRADDALSAYRDAVALLPVALGYQGPHTYLVLARDSSELLGSGGYGLAYGLVTIDHGQLTRVTFGDTNELRVGDWPPPDPQNYVTPPPALTQYLLHGWPMSLADVSWWLDFPTSAQQAMEVYQVNTRDPEPIDGVIGIDSYTIQALLGVMGPLAVQQFDVTVTAADVIRQELVITNPAPGTARSDGLDPRQFGVLLGSETFDRLQQLPAAQWPQMVSTLRDLVQHRDVAVYDRDPRVQQEIDRLGASGSVPAAAGSDFVMVADASVGHSKMNLVVQRRTALYVSLRDDGSATDQLTLSYALPMAAWTRSDPDLARVFGQPSYYFGDYIRVLAPNGTELLSVSLNGIPIAHPEPVTSEAGHREFAAYMELGENQAATVIVVSRVQNVASRTKSTMEYRLQLLKQPGTSGGPASITLQPPAGWIIVSAALDGHRVSAPTGVVTTDFSQDRNLVFELARAS